jgi:uncharacterized protein (TIGR03435 family)
VRLIANVIALLAVGGGLSQAQDARPAYEVASIKLNTSPSNGSSINGDRAQVIFTNVPLRRLIQQAYSVQAFQVNGPGWLDDVRFDIAAKYPPNLKNQDRPLMLQTLLADQLNLTVHHETKDVSGYAMAVAKGGFKLKPVEPHGSSTQRNGAAVHTVTLKAISMEAFAENLSRWLSQIVIDKTGIGGVYDFQFRYKDDNQAQADDAEDAPSLFIAVQETMGVRLQSEKVPVDMIVVDHVERAPSEN